MPLYPLACSECSHREEILAEMRDRNTVRLCMMCGAPMRRAIEEQNVNVIGDIKPGYDESLGVHIGSRREKREQLAYRGAYSPDLMYGSEPSAGRLTSEERAIVEGRPVYTKGSSFGRQDSDRASSVDQDMIATEGEADYTALIDDIKSRSTRYGN